MARYLYFTCLAMTVVSTDVLVEKIYYGKIAIKKFGDYTNYLRIVAQELGFDLNYDDIKVYGYLGQNTPHFIELKKNIKQLAFGNRPANLKFGYVFDELMDHQYFDLFASEIQRP